MHTRPYTRADIPHCADIHCKAFQDNPLWELRAPHRAKYPLAWFREAAKVQNFLLLRSQVFGFVCVADPEDVTSLRGHNGEKVRDGQVLGYSWWTRKTLKPEEDPWIKGRKQSIGYKLEIQLRQAENLYEQYICPNPIHPKEGLEYLGKAMASHKPFERVDHVTHWHMHILAIAPAFQGKGVGGLLVRFGANETMRETSSLEAESMNTGPKPIKDRIMTLIASKQGRWLYEKQGWRAICARDGTPDTIKLPTLADETYAMIWDPTGAWTESFTGLSTDQHLGYKQYVVWKELMPGLVVPTSDQVEVPNDVVTDPGLAASEAGLVEVT